nr:hypothetical protein [Tanacetum cinerariifolium]
APPSPDYIPGPEEPEQAPPSPDYIPGPKHADDEIVAEDQPYAEDASPIGQSPEYVSKSDFEAHPEDDDDEDPEEDPVDYPADGGDDGNDEDDEDDEMDIEADEQEEEEEEHPAPANSVVIAPTAPDQAPSAEETEPFETNESAPTPPPHPAYRTTARISIPAPVPMPDWTDSEVVRLLAISSPPASPLSPWSSPPPQIPFPPLPPILSPLSPILSPAPPPSPIRSLSYRLPSASRREDRPEVTLPPQKRLDIALGPRYEVGESSSATAARPAGGFRADYGFVATGAPVSTDTELGGYVRATDVSDLVYGEVMSLRTTVLDHRRFTEISELRTALQGQVTALQGQVTTLQAQVTTLQGQQRLARDPIQPELPEEAGGNSNESRVTYTDISSPFEELSDIGSSRADDYEHLKLPEMLEDPYVEVALQAPPSPDYIPGPEEPEQAPPLPDYVPGPGHADDEIVAEDQPYAEDALPNAQSPEYVLEYDLEAYPEDDDDEDLKKDPVDYPADEGDENDDEEGSLEDDEDNDMDIEADEEEEEEEHPTPADSVVAALTAADQAPSAEETEPFETDESAATPPPHPAYRMTARISIPAPVPMPAWSDSEIVRLLDMSSLPASPLSHWSSPPPHISFPPLPSILSPPSHVLSPAPPPSPIRESSSAAAILAGGLRADYGYVATMDREIMHDPEREVGYGITDSWDEIVETLQGAPVSTDTELGGYMREFETRVRQDTDEIYMRLDDEQAERQLLAGWLNMLFRDRRAHAYTHHLMKTEARMSREAWVRVTDASDLVHGKVMSMCTTVLGQMSEIRELQAANRKRQTVISELLRIDHRRSTEILELRTALQGQVTALQGQKQMAPKRTTRSTADQETINATSVTNAQLQAMIDQGVTATSAARDALRSTNGDDSHNSETGALKELPVFPNGVKEWSLSFTSATALLKTKSSLLHALFILLL